MLKLLAPLLRRLGGFALSLLGSTAASGASGAWVLVGVIILAVCLGLPLFGLKCAHSRLEDLRANYQSLQSERAGLESALALCSEAASLNDAVLTARERENRLMTNKYKRLRADLLRGLSPTEENNASQKPQDPKADYASWCARPVPVLLRRLLAAGADGPASVLPEPSGPAAPANGSAAAAKP